MTLIVRGSQGLLLKVEDISKFFMTWGSEILNLTSLRGECRFRTVAVGRE
jgi:hypothetical protein